MYSTFIAVNQRIIDFKDWKSKVTIANAIAMAGGAIGLVVSFSGGFDWVLPRVLVYLTGKPEMAAAWQPGNHWGLKALVSLLILVFFYLLVFAVQAMVLLAEQAATTSIVPVQPDYRAQLASAIGVTFSSVRDYYDVTNDNGDCHVIHEAQFQVGDFDLSHLERKLNSSSSISRGTPFMEVPLHPPNVQTQTQVDTTSNQHVYHFRFLPPISRSATNCMVKLTEDMRRGIWMCREDVTFDRVLGGNLESISHLVNEPTEKLELEVTFPRGYTVAVDRNFKVRLGTTENVHAREEERLTQADAVSVSMQNDRQNLKMLVEKPVMGLCYFLCWVPCPRPPNKAGQQP